MNSIAKWISGIFSPLWMPTYALIILMTTSYLVVIPALSRWIVVAVIFFITGVIPLSALALMKKWGFIGDLDIKDRTQRTSPFIVILICYVCGCFFLQKAGLPLIVVNMVRGATLAVLLMILISRWWKISAHAAGTGALIGMVGVEATRMLTVSTVFPIFVVAVLVAGLVGSSRVFLERHTLLQVIAGWALGLTCVVALC